MRVRIIGHLGEPFMKIGVDGPWFEFVKVLKENGCEIIESNFGSQTDLLIANTHSNKALKEASASGVSKNKIHLILWEPRVIDHLRHSNNTLIQYGFVWSPSLFWAKSVKTHLFNWPQLSLQKRNDTIDEWSHRQNKAVMVLANKSSPVKGELYSLRRELGYRTAKTNIMDLYGDKWGKSKFYSYRHYLGRLVRTPYKLISFKSWKYLGKKQKNYKGNSADKTQTCTGYRIVVVLENSADYISEKFFDAYASGSIVIYVGPNLTDFGIPQNSAIQIRPDARSIINEINKLRSLDVKEQFEIAKAQQLSILSVSADWYCNLVMQKLAKDIFSSTQA